MAARLLSVLCLVAAALAQREEPAYGHSRHGAEFDEGPRGAATLLPGLGACVHFPVAGLDAEAQRWFDQGVTQQHGFWYFEAERSFREVLRRFPECALAHWGIAMANVENPARAAGFAAMAVQRAAALPERERLYVDAIAALYAIDGAARAELQSGDVARATAAKDAVVAAAKQGRDEKALGRAFVRGLEAVVAACPDDVEAKAFLAIQVWRNEEHGVDVASHAAVDALLDQVFARAPLHPAHHYRVHLWDRERAERALRSAAVLGDTAPAIAHQWHMAGHVYARLHRHDEAAWQQEASSRVDHAHMAHARVMPFLIHNYAHNQEWLARSLCYRGDGERALAIATNLAELPRHPVHNRVDDGEHAAGYARARIVQVCEDLEAWEAAVALCTDGHVEAGASVKADVQRLGLLGRALFRLGRLAEAERVVTDAGALLVKARAERAAAIDRAEERAYERRRSADKVREAVAEAGREPSGSVRAVLDLQRELRGERLLASGDAAAAVAEFEAVADFPKTLLADAFVVAGRPEQAIELLEKEVEQRPNRVATTARLLIAHVAAAKDPGRMRTLAAELTAPCDGAMAPLLRRCRAAVAGCALDLPRSRPGPSQRLAGDDGEPVFPAFPDDFGERPPLPSLGPLAWAPFANAGFELPRVLPPRREPGLRTRLAADGVRSELQADGGWRASAPRAIPDARRPTLVIFYLGFGCVQCVAQLRAVSPHVAAYAEAGIDVVAIGDQAPAAAAEALAALPDGERFVFPLLADPELCAFRAWHCFDDFEQLPLHGTFLVDADGRVRWQDIGAVPFTDFAWLLAESRRLLSFGGAAPAK